MDAELFDAPFNLAGESQSSELTAEGQARAKAEADAIARKAQATFYDSTCERCGALHYSSLPHCASCHVELWS